MHHVGKVLFWFVVIVGGGVLIYALFFGTYVVQALDYETPTSLATNQTNSNVIAANAQLLQLNHDFPSVTKQNYTIILRNSTDCAVFAYESNVDLGLGDPCPTAIWNSNAVRGLGAAWKLSGLVRDVFSQNGIKNFGVRIKRQWLVIRPSPPEALRIQD